MSVIQKIQDKYAKLMAIVIAVALMIFVVMLAFENGGRLFSGGNSTTVGKVNGTTIEYTEFLKQVEQQEKNLKAQYQQYGGAPSNLQQQSVENAWNQEVNGIIESREYEKLGISVGKKEMGDILYGPNAPEPWKRLFVRSDSEVFNGAAAKAQIDQMLKMKKGTAEQIDQRGQIIAYINDQERVRLRDKYNSMVTNSVNYPKWFIEKQIADNSQLAKISLVRDNYAANADSTIKVTDKEIQDYLDKHKKDYQQREESRSIAYVSFSTQPSAADSAAAKNKVLALKPEMDTVKDVQKFLAVQGAQFSDAYLSATAIRIPVKDSIFNLPVGGVYGPYLDANTYTIAKLLGIKNQPDTVKVRHILVATTRQNPQTGQSSEVRDTATAKKLIDSIQTAIKNGAKFDSLVKLSDDDPNGENPQRGKYKGGIYDRVTAGQMVPTFNDFIFGNPVGAKGVVKTEYGYHYIEILSQKGNSKAYKIAYLPKPIETSTETEVNASNMASQFAGDSRDQKSFDANAEKLSKEKGIIKSVSGDITPSSYSIGGLGQSRTLVKNIFNAKLGEVLEPEKAGENYVVAIVTEINEEGTMSLTKARPQIEPVLRNIKIADKLKAKAGSITTLEAAAASLGGKPIETIDSLRMLDKQSPAVMKTGLTNEPKVMGAAFNPANKGKVVSECIAGSGGVYVIRVDNVMATAVAEANVADQRKVKYQQGKQQAMGQSPIQVLRETATIKDRRIRFF